MFSFEDAKSEISGEPATILPVKLACDGAVFSQISWLFFSFCHTKLELASRNIRVVQVVPILAY